MAVDSVLPVYQFCAGPEFFQKQGKIEWIVLEVVVYGENELASRLGIACPEGRMLALVPVQTVAPDPGVQQAFPLDLVPGGVIASVVHKDQLKVLKMAVGGKRPAHQRRDHF
jgi:hypothetical protein